jgi:hypothetical protein
VSQHAEDLRRRREELFTGLVRAFARGDHQVLEDGDRPDVVGGTSWLAGKYRGLLEPVATSFHQRRRRTIVSAEA